MKRLRNWLWAGDALALVLTIGAFFLAPAVVPMHWNNLGNQDATAPRAALFLQFAVVVVTGGAIQGLAYAMRRRAGLLQIPLLLPKEYGLLFCQAVILVVLAGTLASQIGWL